MIEAYFAKMATEKKTIKAMVEMYCLAHHKANTGICQECVDVLDYARLRLDRCPFGEKKGPCAKCAIHCYSPSMRARITAVMRYAGPRMITKHPIMVLLHGRR